MKKIPELTALFWIAKICATTLGETAGDLLSMTLDIGYAFSSMFFLALFLLTAAFQFSSKKYIPFIYWSVILSTSTAGTTISDYIDRTLGLGYAKGSLLIIIVLLLILSIWRITEKSLSVTDITTRRAELFYWLAILVSNTLGTAFGDYLADNSGLGFGKSALLIGMALSLLVLCHYYTKIADVFLFWMAFILTRPFGATFGDLLTKTTEKGGLNYGTKGASLILASLLILLIVYEMKKLKTIKISF